MRICIHRGTQEIGGTCIEIEAQGRRIVLDLGLPLDAPDREAREDLLPKVPGFTEPDDSLLGLLISTPTGTTTVWRRASVRSCRFTSVRTRTAS